MLHIKDSPVHAHLLLAHVYTRHKARRKLLITISNRGVWVIHSDRVTSRCLDLVESCMIRNHRGSSTCAIYIYDVACVLHVLDVLSFSIQKGTTCKVKPQNLGVTWGVWDSTEQLFRSYPLKDPKDASASRQGSKIQLRTAPFNQGALKEQVPMITNKTRSKKKKLKLYVYKYIYISFFLKKKIDK